MIKWKKWAFSLMAAAVSASAQTTPPSNAEPTFEVASVKPNKTGAPGGSFVMPPGRFTATNIPLRVLITNAYQLSFFQVVGGPDWIGTDRFDITAKAPDGAPPEQTRAMVRTLLKERFKLVVHMEMRDTPIYALVKARADDRLGPSLKRSTMDCGPVRTQRAAATAAAARARGAAPVPVPSSPGPNEQVVCGMRLAGRGGATLTYRAANITLAALANALRTHVGREVVDRTGLTGEFDFDLQFATPATSAAPDRGVPIAPLDEAASVFTALQEQLGLKLESTRGQLELMVIDSAERPTEN
jgi:uncharacterized protein (TIGR03435 family)